MYMFLAIWLVLQNPETDRVAINKNHSFVEKKQNIETSLTEHKVFYDWGITKNSFWTVIVVSKSILWEYLKEKVEWNNHISSFLKYLKGEHYIYFCV